MLSVSGSFALLGTLQTAVAQEANQLGDEIVVTATKRETTLQDTPLAVSVVGSDTIEKRNLIGMDDYLAALPGVSYQDRGAGSNAITIRGIALGSQIDPNSPVGNYFGEVPTTGLASAVNGNQAGNSDVKMVDIQRIEVLRGPQGTLYGSGSMGGTVRIIPNAPNLLDWEGSVKAQYSHTGRQGGHNYSIEGVVNAPLIADQLALRVAAYHFSTEGWIDNVAASRPTPGLVVGEAQGVVLRDREQVGGDKTSGVRASLLWQPVADLSVTATYLRQWMKQDGFREVEPGLGGDYRQAHPRVGVNGDDDEFVDVDLQIANLVVEYDLGWGSILNSTSIIDNMSHSDLSLMAFTDAIFIGVGSRNKVAVDSLVNELRFASDWGGPLQVIAGLYYEKRKAVTNRNARWNGVGPTPPGRFLRIDRFGTDQKQYAAFGEASLTPWDPLTVTVGARYFKFDQTSLASTLGSVSSPPRNASIDGVNWKVNLAFKPSEQVFLYAQWAQGFREPRFQLPILPEYDANGNGLVEFADGIERKVTEGLLDPDQVDNYEIGVKFQSRGFRGSLTGFWVDWEGIPLVPSLTAFSGAALYFNAGKAVSKGIELELSGEVGNGLFAEFSASWVDAKLVEGAAALGVRGGGQPPLPGSADHNIKAALEKRFVIAGQDAFVRGDYSYISEYYSQLQATGRSAGDYHLFDASAGVTIGNLKVGVFAKNLTNRKDFTWVDNVFPSGRAYRLRPRTIGVNLGMNF